jgi:hypothetical protein
MTSTAHAADVDDLLALSGSRLNGPLDQVAGGKLRLPAALPEEFLKQNGLDMAQARKNEALGAQLIGLLNTLPNQRPIGVL